MKRTQTHVMVISDLLTAEEEVQKQLTTSMEHVIKRCPRKFQKVIMKQYAEYLTKTINQSFNHVIDRTDLFLTTKDEGKAITKIFNARFEK